MNKDLVIKNLNAEIEILKFIKEIEDMNKDLVIEKLKTEIKFLKSNLKELKIENKILESNWEELKDFIKMQITEIETFDCERCYIKVETKMSGLEREANCKDTKRVIDIINNTKK